MLFNYYIPQVVHVASRYATTSNPVGLYPIPWEMAQITKRHHDTGLFLSTYNNLYRDSPWLSVLPLQYINTKAGEVHDGSRCFVVLATLPLLFCMYWSDYFDNGV